MEAPVLGHRSFVGFLRVGVASISIHRDAGCEAHRQTSLSVAPNLGCTDPSVQARTGSTRRHTHSQVTRGTATEEAPRGHTSRSPGPMTARGDIPTLQATAVDAGPARRGSGLAYAPGRSSPATRPMARWAGIPRSRRTVTILVGQASRGVWPRQQEPSNMGVHPEKGGDCAAG